MSYADLSQRLLRLSEQLRQHEARLEGPALAKLTTTFTKALASYEKKLGDFLQGNAPGAREFQDLLKSPQAKKHLTLPALKVIFKGLLGEQLKEETLAKAKATLAQRVKESGHWEPAGVYLKEFFFQAATPPPLAEDKESLQREFLRLGALTDEELDFQIQHRFKTVGALKKLANANAINFTPKTSKQKLLEMIIHYAQRAHRNVGT